MTIYVCSRGFPARLDAGGFSRLRAVVRAASSLDAVTLVSDAPDDRPTGPLADELRSLVAEWATVPREVSPADTSQAFAAIIRRMQPASEDRMILSRTYFVRSHREWADSALLDLDDLEFLKMARQRRIGGGDASAYDLAATAFHELGRTQAFRRRTVASAVDARRFRLLRIDHLPNVADFVPDERPALADGELSVAFMGNLAYHANLDSLQFLLEEIMPRVRVAQPEARLTVIGGNAPDGYFDQCPSWVEATGFVDDLQTELARHSVFAAPVRYGSGTKTKLLSSFAAGLPVVTSPEGANGFSFDGSEVVVADGADAFASAVLRALGSRQCREELASSAFRYLVREHSLSSFAGRLDTLLA